MRDLVKFIGLTIIGLALGFATGFNPLQHPQFSLFASIALTFGLYTAVAGIDLPALGRYKNTAIFIITAGVPLQIALIAGFMWLIYPHPVSILVAVAIDQIDPLSVSTLLNNKLGMSKEAKALLRVWASFDDPVTVLVGFAFLVPAITGVISGSMSSYLVSLLLNIVPAIVLYWFSKQKFFTRPVSFVLLGLVFAFTVWQQTYLLAALCGLFIRPLKNNLMEKVTEYLYYVVIVVVGAAVVDYGVDLRLGALLALGEFFIVQPLSALLLVKGTTNDIFRLAFAQQNGLTTILMGLVFQVMGFNVLPILLPAILIINTLNLSINALYSWKESHGQLVTKPDKSALKKLHNTVSYS